MVIVLLKATGTPAVRPGKKGKKKKKTSEKAVKVATWHIWLKMMISTDKDRVTGVTIRHLSHIARCASSQGFSTKDRFVLKCLVFHSNYKQVCSTTRKKPPNQRVCLLLKHPSSSTVAQAPCSTSYLHLAKKTY